MPVKKGKVKKNEVAVPVVEKKKRLTKVQKRLEELKEMNDKTAGRKAKTTITIEHDSE